MESERGGAEMDAAEVKAQMDGLMESITAGALLAVRTQLPWLVVHLSDILDKRFGTSVPTDAMLPIARDRILEAPAEEILKPNAVLTEMLISLRREVLDAIDIFNAIKIWIHLNIPRIEDGNNFGVGIQEETIAELSRSEDGCLSVLESMTKYFVMRGKLCSKILKYPAVLDYRHSVLDLDEKEWIALKNSLTDVRNNAAILNDMIVKNWDKITKPRESPANLWH